MNLAAALVVRNELNRYLPACIDHLRAFCDQIVVLDDASTDGTTEWLADHADEQLKLLAQSTPTFYVHEGSTRSTLLAATLAERPSHVLPIDGDELVTDGSALRALLEAQPDVPAWHLPIEEVWAATDTRYMTREDGGWSQGRTLVWKVSSLARLSFPNRALACGRVPAQIRMLAAQPSAVSLLHLGWLDESERVARHARYVKHDRGRFHRLTHLNSILWPPEKISLQARAWPDGLLPWKDAILAHAGVAA